MFLRKDFGLKILLLPPDCFLCFVLGVDYVSFQLLAPAKMSTACCHASLPLWTQPPGNIRPNKLFLMYVALVTVECHSNKKVTNTEVMWNS